MDLASLGGGGLGGGGIEAKSQATTSFGDVSRGGAVPDWLLPVIVIAAGLLLASFLLRKS